MAIDWKTSGVFTFGSAGDSSMKTVVTHISGKTQQLNTEDQFDGEKQWEILDNWNELRAQLNVGKAVTRVLDLFDEGFREQILKDWANNKDFIQKVANDQNSAADQAGDDCESSVPSASSQAAPAPAPAASSGEKRKAGPPPKPRVRIVAKRVS